MENEIIGLLKDWDLLITRISYMEIKLYNLKDELFNKEQDIIDNTDFKELYGKNNSDVRRKHLKEELKELYDEVFTLELKVNECKRRLSFMKENIRVKRELLVISYE